MATIPSGMFFKSFLHEPAQIGQQPRGWEAEEWQPISNGGYSAEFFANRKNRNYDWDQITLKTAPGQTRNGYTPFCIKGRNVTWNIPISIPKQDRDYSRHAGEVCALYKHFGLPLPLTKSRSYVPPAPLTLEERAGAFPGRSQSRYGFVWNR